MAGGWFLLIHMLLLARHTPSPSPLPHRHPSAGWGLRRRRDPLYSRDASLRWHDGSPGAVLGLKPLPLGSEYPPRSGVQFRNPPGVVSRPAEIGPDVAVSIKRGRDLL